MPLIYTRFLHSGCSGFRSILTGHHDHHISAFLQSVNTAKIVCVASESEKYNVGKPRISLMFANASFFYRYARLFKNRSKPRYKRDSKKDQVKTHLVNRFSLISKKTHVLYL